MKYTSEIIQKVITSEPCKKALERITPIYADAENFLAILNAIFLEVERFATIAAQLRDESMPQTARDLLYLWEQEYRVAKDVTLTVEERRARVVAKIRARKAMNPYRLQEIIRAETGVAAQVIENTGPNRFHVRLWAESQADLRHGLQIQNIINRHKPAHLICDVSYEMPVNETVYVGGVVMASKRISLHQIDAN